ncbi:MAG: N-acetyl-gamma-glutamyl-phosphate reductase [Sphaerochaetaceae bacterium]|jgi:N-acetyl-gamma-glutamyl-phosphate reductase
MDKLRVGVVGSTGYAGSELIRLLVRHPHVGTIYAASKTYEGMNYSSVFPNFKNIYDVVCVDAQDIASLAQQVDVLLLSLPHGISSFNVTSQMIKETIVIDLGADFRLKDISTYESWYNTQHGNKELVSQAVYGLSELYREEIQQTRLVANPGCYTTASIISCYPLIKEGLIDPHSLIIDAKSGVSGAGRGEKLPFLFGEANENIKAYGIGTHRHTPEIEEHLSFASKEKITLSFTPHLVPMNRGILITAYGSLNEGVTAKEIDQAYHTYYEDEYFIRLLGEGSSAETRWVKGSNYCDIGFIVDQRTNRVVISCAIDNLVKGASGQAVQNMNIMCGFDERDGIDMVPPFPI